MEDRSHPLNPFDEMPLDNENSNMGSVHSFTRKNRGKRREIIDEEAKKIDDEFWKNNSLFREEQQESVEQVDHNDQHSDQPKEQESENEDQNGHDENGIDEEDDDDEDEDYSGEMLDSEDNEIESEEEEMKSNKDKTAAEENNSNKKPQEEEEEDEAFKLFLKNREKHFFFRPIFMKADIETIEKQDVSYIILPEEMTLQSGKNETEIAQQTINRRYIGVPPKANEEFKLPVFYPTNYNVEMFKYEDERYSLDLNIQRYKIVTRWLEDVWNTQDENIKKQKLTNVLNKNKMAKQKYMLDDSEDETNKLRNVINEITHDLENLYKRRAHLDITTKRKKELLYPLAVHESEIRYAANEKQLLGNSKLINEISKNFQNVPLKKITSSNSEGIIEFKSFYKIYQNIFFENELHKALFKESEFYEIFNKFIQNLFVSYRASPYSILPSNIFYIENKAILNQAVQLILFSIKHFAYADSENLLLKLTSIIETFFGIDLENQTRSFDVDSLQFQDLIESLISYQKFKPEEFMPGSIYSLTKSTSTPTEMPKPHDFHFNPDMSPPFSEEFKLFLPPANIVHVELERVEDVNGKVSYGTHFSYFIIRYIYLIYLKLLLAYKANGTSDDIQLEDSQSKLDILMNLIAAHAQEKIDTPRYELAVLNLFGSKGKYLLNIKALLQQISKAMLSLISDDLSHRLFEKLLTKTAEEESEQELFTFTCELINSTDEFPDTENFVYRFHIDPSKGWFSTSIFDVKGVFMRTIKTQEKSLKYSNHKNSPKKIQIKRVAVEPVLQETKEIVSVQVTDTILVKRNQQVLETESFPDEEGDLDPVKKVHTG